VQSQTALLQVTWHVSKDHSGSAIPTGLRSLVQLLINASSWRQSRQAGRSTPATGARLVLATTRTPGCNNHFQLPAPRCNQSLNQLEATNTRYRRRAGARAVVSTNETRSLHDRCWVRSRSLCRVLDLTVHARAGRYVYCWVYLQPFEDGRDVPRPTADDGSVV
jgi:hypothetical protein